MENKEITAGLEDYLEAIYVAKNKNTTVKGIDIAHMLNISRASVSEALSKLMLKGLINYESYGTVSFTKKGLVEAEKVYNTHNTLKAFFQTVLDISPEEANDNACRIEHIITQKALTEIKNFTDYCNNNPEIINNYKQRKERYENLSDREISGSTPTNSKTQ